MPEEPIPHTSRETSRYAADGAGNWREVELDAKASVEYETDAKGVVRVKTSKAYHNDPKEAARLAYAGLTEAQELLAQGKAQP